MRIGLIPLDERPVNTRYPAMIAAIANAELALPPPERLSSFRTPAPCDALAAWLRDVAGNLDALIVSFEMLGYGGLIASRITNESAGTVVARLETLRDLKHQYPSLPLLGFNLLTRISNADDATEEPDYWARYGRQMYQYSTLLDQAKLGQPVERQLTAVRAGLPETHLQDFQRRRLRNHTVNLLALDLLESGTLDLLVLSSDDTSPYGLPSREKRWIAEWAERLGLDDRLLMYPGADEVGCALLARLLNGAAGKRPSFEPFYTVPSGEQQIAAYEDGPIHTTIERQVRAVGGIVSEADGDLWLGVNPPVPRRGEWDAAHAAEERSERLPFLEVMVARIRQHQHTGRPVVVADVAYPNGADPVLIELLRAQARLPELASYGGWNTAGNTIGTALAHACAFLQIRDQARHGAHERFLLHRFLEDWGYQRLVRPHVRGWLREQTGDTTVTAENLQATTKLIEARLQALVAELPGFAGRYRIVPGSVRLPWQRTFEVDFDVDERPTTNDQRKNA
jgi:hypothetical protein